MNGWSKWLWALLATTGLGVLSIVGRLVLISTLNGTPYNLWLMDGLHVGLMVIAAICGFFYYREGSAGRTRA